MGSPFAHRFFFRFKGLTTHDPTLCFLVLAGTTLRSHVSSGLCLSWGISLYLICLLICLPSVLTTGHLSVLGLGSRLLWRGVSCSGPLTLSLQPGLHSPQKHSRAAGVRRGVPNRVGFQGVRVDSPVVKCAILSLSLCLFLRGSWSVTLYWGNLS